MQQRADKTRPSAMEYVLEGTPKKLNIKMIGYLRRLAEQYREPTDDMDTIEDMRERLNKSLAKSMISVLGNADVKGIAADNGRKLAQQKIEEAIRETSDTYRPQEKLLRTAIDDVLNPSNRLQRAVALVDEAGTILQMVVELQNQ